MRKTLVACLILLIALTSPALAAGRRFVIDDAYDCQVLVDEDGVLYTPTGVYRGIFEATEGEWPEEERLFRAAGLVIAQEYKDGDEWGGYALLDAWGNLVTDRRAEFENFNLEPGGNILVERDWLEGLLDREGNVLIEPEFEAIFSNGEGGYLATLPLGEDSVSQGSGDEETGKSSRLIHFDASWNRTDTELTVYDLGEFADGLAPVRMQVGETAVREDDFREGYVDARGELIIAPIFKNAESFAAGVGKAKAENGLWGLIRPDGSWALAPEYDWLYDYYNYWSEPVILAYADDYHTARLIDRATFAEVASFSAEGGYVPPSIWGTWERVAPGLFRLMQYDGQGEADTLIVDIEGRELFRAEDAAILSYNLDLAALPPVLVMSGNWQYLVNLRGEQVSVHFAELTPHCTEGGELRFRAHLSRSPAADWGVIDARGAYLIQPVFERLEYIGNDRYLARYEGKFGVFHASGVEILPLQYDWMYDLGDGLFEARLGDTRGLLDIDGNWRISFSDYEVLVD